MTKAIVRIPTKKNRGGGEPTGSTLKRLMYIFMPKKPGAARDVDDRVLWVAGDLGGFGFPLRDARLMAEALECGHEHFPGRRTRHLIVSCAAGLPEVKRAEAFGRLYDSAPLLAKAIGADRWMAAAHDDTDCPHFHFACANFDKKKARRLDITPKLLKWLQTMDWTIHLESGKRKRTKRKSKRGMAIEEALERKEKGRWAKKNVVIRKLRDFLVSKRAPAMGNDDLADWLMEAHLPPGWEKEKLKAKSGKNRFDPAIIIDGEGLKFSRFFNSLGIEKPGMQSPSGAAWEY
jgi:hypothetical protein